jgi:hypothetical protein
MKCSGNMFEGLKRDNLFIGTFFWGKRDFLGREKERRARETQREREKERIRRCETDKMYICRCDVKM